MKRLSLPLVLSAVVLLLFAGGVASAADGYRGGTRSGGFSRSGGHYGGYYGGGYRRGGDYYRGRGYYGSYYGRRGYYGRWYPHYGRAYWGPRYDYDFWFGGPFWGWPWYDPFYYPYYSPGYYSYYYPYSSGPEVPQEYIERSPEDSSSQPSGIWYYCPKSRTYYPYVRECPDGWQKVPAQPGPESGR